ncbi:ABC transporter ATP-binding protein [bacterium]|nr:ABC transporter ATP-binding protein [bacterium]
MGQNLIEARNLVKRFGEKTAVDGVSLQVKKGEIFGFLGPNGAGKTTTIRMLAGALDPDEGEIQVFGTTYQQAEKEIKRRIGVLPEEPPVFKNITGHEFLKFVASIYRCGDEVFAKIDELCELLNINFLHEFVDNYSHGMKQKLMLVSVLMHDPEIMFLDEPTTGLDPVSARGLKLLLRKRVEAGATVFMTTHILEIAEKMCDRMAVISEGKIIAEGTIEQLRTKAGTSGDLEDIFLQLTGARESDIRKLVEEL